MDFRPCEALALGFGLNESRTKDISIEGLERILLVPG